MTSSIDQSKFNIDVWNVSSGTTPYVREESTARNRDYFPEKRNPLLYKDLLPSQIVLDSHTKHAEQEQESYVISSDEEEYYRISSDEDEYFLISSDEEEEYQIISSKKMTPFDSIPPVLRSSALPHPQGESSSAKKKRRVPGTRSRQLEKRMRKLQKRIMVRCHLGSRGYPPSLPAVIHQLESASLDPATVHAFLAEQERQNKIIQKTQITQTNDDTPQYSGPRSQDTCRASILAICK
ncbi:hypothetical protein BCR43DRAFT_504952 [Syncephalastrum racemosum]|uniref:Uncharacterized protein n=1 Tax=Syncephalastrum racemosum TaxID=13706 RepID=A0A1X2HGS8_SYNRA|nr:hypothetical protein BCR43DRAFT_504952 [Syncephalastrum racemosum]